MSNTPVISLVLHGHAPFVRNIESASIPQEQWLFESLSETYIPLLQVFERLDRDHVPFKVGLSLSPTLCHMLTDEVIIERYLNYVDKQIEFGQREQERASGNPEILTLAKYNYDKIIEKRIVFTEKYEKNILKGFDSFQKKGRVEILATAATHAFLPFYTNYPEAVQAQFEVSLHTYRSNFGKYPQGFWLPELGWKDDLDSWLRAYNFCYTIVDSHSLPFGRPAAEKGNFYPVKTALGTIVFGRNFYASKSIEELSKDPLFRFYYRDQGFELQSALVNSFLGKNGSRIGTGFKYWAAAIDNSGNEIYQPELAIKKAQEKAKEFFKTQYSQLIAAAGHMDQSPLSLCAFEADTFGRFWHEGPEFLECFFREAAETENLYFMSPADYYYKQDNAELQTLMPEFSSWGSEGYAQTWLDASNDWMYYHTMRALERMVEIAERFPNNTGLKERALNQAAREILLVLASDWSKLLCRQEGADYAKSKIESSLRNFTTIYEALGSNYISTEWLTQLEKRHNIFPNINYRVFRRKN